VKDTGEAEGSSDQPTAEEPAERVGYFSSRLRPNERTAGLVLVVASAALSVGTWTADYIDTKDTKSLALAAAGLGLSLLLWLAINNGRRVVAAFAAILPPLIPPPYKQLALAQFVYFAYAAWLMVKASNEASRSAAARRERTPRMTPAERSAARRAGKQAPVTSASGRTPPKPNKRYTPPAPKKKRTPPPVAESKPTGSRWGRRGATSDAEELDDV
jgi:hypothetical protein